MLFAEEARMLTEDHRPKDATLEELLDETHDAIWQAVENGEYSTAVIIRRFVPRDVRKEYKLKMKKELGYRLSYDWDELGSIIHIWW
jgi:hypothetical protein